MTRVSRIERETGPSGEQQGGARAQAFEPEGEEEHHEERKDGRRFAAVDRAGRNAAARETSGGGRGGADPPERQSRRAAGPDRDTRSHQGLSGSARSRSSSAGHQQQSDDACRGTGGEQGQKN